MDSIPINWGIIKSPFNWAIVLLMVIIAGLAIEQICKLTIGSTGD